MSRAGDARNTRPSLEKKLAATEARLRKETAERERLEGQHREAERCLREERERFESAFGNAPIGMALIDMDGHWLQVNHALCRITGHTEDELKATTLRAITRPEDVDLDVEDRRDLLAGRIPSYHVEKRYRHAWGHDVWVLLTVSLVRDEKGDVLYAITQAQDVSERNHRGLGCQFALHDFGAGFGSFYYIKSLPFDYLKIDGAFIRGLATSPMDQLIVQAIVSIAKGLRKKTVAEFVADAATVGLLRQLGVDYAQGYQIGRPRPIADLLDRSTG